MADLEQAVLLLKNKLNYKNLLVTLGENGAVGYDHTELYYEPAEKLDIVDVCGAGDAVVAIATLCLVSGLTLKETLYWVNRSGAEVCKYPGVVAVDRNALVNT